MSEEEKTKEEETKEKALAPALTALLIKLVLSYGDKQPLKLADALGSLAMAGLEVYNVSKLGAQNPAPPADGDKTEKA